VSEAITSTLLATVPRIKHGFGTAAELVPAVLQPHWSQRPDKTQVHSSEICHVTGPNHICGSADGLFTNSTGVPISVVHGDCVPILLARADGEMGAALHAGWRGILAGIVESFGSRLASMGERPSQWVAAVGPAIGPCCYEVAEELGARFEAQFPHIPATVIQPAFRRLDLPSIVNFELQRLGVWKIETITKCTYCDRSEDSTHRFRSYRRGDRGPQQHSGLMIID
jgi:polyphenol oxidase